ncbi:MAG TPA: HEAT repeat domain-containing protein, partial [Roseiflexaceae bacterium]|nr:HEAT repeat domain-containing protein [Roseiflexaceae bacterium]
ALLERFADARNDVRAAAVEALGGLAERDGAVRVALLERLADEGDNVRAMAAQALGGLAERDEAVRTTLLERLTDDDSYVRAAVVGALGGLAERDEAVRTALLERLFDEGYGVRAAVLEATLLFLTSASNRLPMLMPLIATDLQQYYIIIDSSLSRRLAERYADLARTDPQLRAAITEQLSAEDWRLRAAAVQILEAAGEDALREALPQLLAALDDRRGLDSWPARLEAAALLLNDDRHGEPALACTLQALAYDTDALFPAEGAAAVRQQAALTLGKLKALHHRRDVAARIAALLGSETVPQALDGLYDALTSLASAPEAEV